MKAFWLTLLGLLIAAPVMAQTSQEVGSYPNATSPLTGTERILADQGSFNTVNITPAQLQNYVFGGGSNVVLPVTLGGTGLASVPTNGQLLIGNGTGFSLGVLTAGSNITITNNAGVITISSTGGSSPGGSSFSLQYNNAGTLGGVLPGETGLHMLNWSSLSAAPTLSAFNAALVVAQFTGCTVPSSDILYADGTCKTGSGMVYPGAGIPNSTGTAWGTSYSATNLIPANFIPTLNQDTTGNAATASAFQAIPAGCSAGQYATGYSDTTLDLVCGTPAGSGTVNAGTSGQVAYYAASGSAVSGLNVTGTGNAMLASGPTFTLPKYTTAGEPACSSGNTAQMIWLTDGAGAFATCNGTTWITAGTTQFTYSGTGCTPSAAAGSVASGTITLAAGPCTSVTITPNGAVGMTANTGWTCSAGDRTLQYAGTWIPKWGESATTQTSITLPIPGAAGATDVISFSCVPY